MKITDRRDFGRLCEHHGFTRGVEIGTDRADFAYHLLKGWKNCEEFWCFDPYEPVGEPPHSHPWDRTPDLMMACARLAEFVPAARIIRMPSTEGPRMLWFKPEFVYIDGLHDYQSVSQDIATWWPQVVPGGILAGHDYCGDTHDVVRAVDDFCKVEGLRPNFTQEPKFAHSWWVYKPGGSP